MVSIVIHRAKNVERAVEAAKRRYERRCHVTDWWLHADGFEMEKSTYSIGRTDSHQRQSPTHRRPRRLYADRPSCNAALMRHCHCGSLHPGSAGSQLIAIAGGQTLQGVSHLGRSHCSSRPGWAGETGAASDTRGCRRGPAASASRCRSGSAARPACPARRPDGRPRYRR